jgi:hypothetical protein
MSVEVAEECFSPVWAYSFYKIMCNDESLNVCYIGKTKDFRNRVSNHKTNSKSSEVKLYRFIRENGSFENFTIEVIHKCFCDDKTSVYVELAFIKQFKEQGYQMLNIQIPNSYALQDYNKMKCEEHYAIKKSCRCGWVGSKMNFSKHIKTSNKHRNFCITEFENKILI